MCIYVFLFLVEYGKTALNLLPQGWFDHLLRFKSMLWFVSVLVTRKYHCDIILFIHPSNRSHEEWSEETYDITIDYKGDPDTHIDIMDKAISKRDKWRCKVQHAVIL